MADNDVDKDMQPLVEKANAMMKLAGEAAQETDPEKAKANAEKLLAMGRELEKMGDDLKAQYRAKAGITRVTVVLTPDQRKRILDKYGIAMETLVIDDMAGAVNQGMPSTRPEEIEILAMKEAESRKHDAEAKRQVKAELTRALGELEAQGNAELNEQVERLKKDPSFAELLKK
jgi:hypothetical protein